MNKSALIFGYNDFSLQIAKNISSKYENITIFKSQDSALRKELKDYNVESFDLSDEWSELKEKHDIKNSIVFSVLEDDAENIFLTISLRAEFDDLHIIALSSNKESANKLLMAGANKVIPLVQTTATMIVEMLDKPITRDVLHNILYEKSDLKVAQIKIAKDSPFKGKYPIDIEWNSEYGVIVLSVIQEDGCSEFIYSKKAKHHKIKEGDMFVVVGYQTDITNFEKIIGGTICH